MRGGAGGDHFSKAKFCVFMKPWRKHIFVYNSGSSPLCEKSHKRMVIKDKVAFPADHTIHAHTDR